jgi:hypothetical protein
MTWPPRRRMSLLQCYKLQLALNLYGKPSTFNPGSQLLHGMKLTSFYSRNKCLTVKSGLVLEFWTSRA